MKLLVNIIRPRPRKPLPALANAKLDAKARLRNNMPLKDLLKKKDKIRDEGAPTSPTGPTLSPDVPEFHFFRTTTTTQESIEPPSFPGDPTREAPLLSPVPRGAFGRFRSRSSTSSQGGGIAERLHFGLSRSGSSVNVPDNLPEVGGDGVARTEDEEAKWEKRATVMVTATLQHSSQPSTPHYEPTSPLSSGPPKSATGTGAPGDEVCITWTRTRAGLSFA